MNGLFVVNSEDQTKLQETMVYLDKVVHDWTLRAARMECSWICADCCMTFPGGMPNSCAHDHQGCTDIIKRDKAEANEKIKESN